MTALDGYARTNQGKGEDGGGGDGRKIARTFATTFKESFSHHLPSLNFSCHGGFRVGMLEKIYITWVLYIFTAIFLSLYNIGFDIIYIRNG